MPKNNQSYELLDYGREHGDVPEKASLNVESTAYDSRNVVVDNTTTALVQGPDAEETPNIPLERKFTALILSLLGHIFPAILTIAVVGLSVFEVYWFDTDASADASENIPWKRGGIKISWNELQNLLQFVAKIHEILLCGSLAAMVMHRVRHRLLSKHGLPFGMLAGGYSVGAPEYLLSSAFRSGFNHRYWLLSLLIFAFTLLMNTIGPASAIALLPTLDWWTMKRPFGSETLPTVFGLPENQWWPSELTVNDTFILYADGSDWQPQETCFSGDAFTTKTCPVSGWNELLSWTTANALGAIDANVTVDDEYSPVQRRLKTRVSQRHDSISGVAITTSMSQTITTIMGAFWEQITSRDYPVNDVVRPQLELADGQTSLQPLVQVQCSPISLSDLKTSKDTTIKTNDDVNTFSSKVASELPIPDWARSLVYEPPSTVGDSGLPYQQSVNMTWIWPENNDYNLSLAAIVTTPFISGDLINWVDTSQTAFLHFCSVDARWVGSQPTYDPSEHLVLAHNVTDPLVFQKPDNGNDDSYKNDITKWGVSPALKLSKEWASSINIPAEVNNVTANTFQWLFGQYVENVANTTTANATADNADMSFGYFFNPGVNGIEYANVTFENFDLNEYALSTAETVSTVLGLQITDALARVHLSDIITGGIITGQINATHDSISWLAGGIAGFDAVGNINVTKDYVDSRPTKILFQVQRYGYGYGLQSATVWFGVLILLLHTLLTFIYMGYSIIDFFFISRWTSSAWGDIGEFAALLINSKPTIELQNTCSGIDSKNTWKKIVRIRETGERHLGIVVGESWMMYPPVKKGTEYGRLNVDVKPEGSGLRKRRASM